MLTYCQTTCDADSEKFVSRRGLYSSRELRRGNVHQHQPAASEIKSISDAAHMEDPMPNHARFGAPRAGPNGAHICTNDTGAGGA
jgi:hypothetical protein